MRKKPRSSSRTAQASTRVAVELRRSRRGRASTRSRSRGSAWAKRDHVVELLRVAPRAPGVVVAVLLAPGGVDARRLQVPVRIRADPHVLPRRRDRRARAIRVEHLGLVDALAVGVEVAEAAPAAPAADPGTGAVGAAQPWASRQFFPARRALGLRAWRSSRSRHVVGRARPPSSRSRGELDLAGAAALEQELDRLADGGRRRARPARARVHGLQRAARRSWCAALRARSARAPPRARARAGAGDARVRHHPHARAARVRATRRSTSTADAWRRASGLRASTCLRLGFSASSLDRGEARLERRHQVGTFAGCGASGWTAISSPAALRSISSSTFSRYSSLVLRRARSPTTASRSAAGPSSARGRRP